MFVHVQLQLVVPKGIVALAEHKEKEASAVARIFTRGKPLSEFFGSARWDLLAIKSTGQGTWAGGLPAGELADGLDGSTTFFLKSESFGGPILFLTQHLDHRGEVLASVGLDSEAKHQGDGS